MGEQEQDSRTRNLDGAIEDLEQDMLVQASDQENADIDVDIIPWVIEFRVVGTPHILHAPVGDSLVFGRRDVARGILPEIDLSEVGAQNLGVSRRHARLLARDNRVTVEDLGSSNGTFINGNRIEVMDPYRIHEGDILQLGNLKLQVHFLIKPSLNDDTLHGRGNALDIPSLGKGQRILILDDNDDVCNVLRFVAFRAGFKPVVVHTVTDAIREVDEQIPHAMIVETMLQEGSGLNLVTYVRKKVGTKKVPVIALGSDASGFQEGQALQTGADFYIPKPLAVDVIIDGLGKIVAGMPTQPL